MKRHSLFMKMKLSWLTALFFLIGIGYSYASIADGPIPLIVGIEDPIPYCPGHGKNPILVPTVMQDGHEITFQSNHPDYTLSIVEDDIVVFSIVVASTTTSVILPSWLNGEYEIQLHPDNCSYFFYGRINL